MDIILPLIKVLFGFGQTDQVHGQFDQNNSSGNYLDNIPLGQISQAYHVLEESTGYFLRAEKSNANSATPLNLLECRYYA